MPTPTLPNSTLNNYLTNFEGQIDQLTGNTSLYQDWYNAVTQSPSLMGVLNGEAGTELQNITYSASSPTDYTPSTDTINFSPAVLGVISSSDEDLVYVTGHEAQHAINDGPTDDSTDSGTFLQATSTWDAQLGQLASDPSALNADISTYANALLANEGSANIAAWDDVISYNQNEFGVTTLDSAQLQDAVNGLSANNYDAIASAVQENGGYIDFNQGDQIGLANVQTAADYMATANPNGSGDASDTYLQQAVADDLNQAIPALNGNDTSISFSQLGINVSSSSTGSVPPSSPLTDLQVMEALAGEGFNCGVGTNGDGSATVCEVTNSDDDSENFVAVTANGQVQAVGSATSQSDSSSDEGVSYSNNSLIYNMSLQDVSLSQDALVPIDFNGTGNQINSSDDQLNFQNPNDENSVDGNLNIFNTGSGVTTNLVGDNNTVNSIGGVVTDAAGDTGNIFNGNQTTINSLGTFNGSLEGSSNIFNLISDSGSSLTSSGTNQSIYGDGNSIIMDGASSSANIYGDDVNLQLGENGTYALNYGGTANIFGNDTDITASNANINIGAGVTNTTFNAGDYNWNDLNNIINMSGGTLNVNANDDESGYDQINMNGTSGSLNFNTPNGGFYDQVDIAPDATVSLNGSMTVDPGAGDTLNIGAGYSQGLGDPAFGTSAASDVTYNMLGNAAYAAEIWAGANNVVNANATWSGDVQAFNGTSTLNLVNNDPNAVSSETQGGLLDIYGENENLTLHEGNVVLEDQSAISENDGSSVQTMAAGSVVNLPSGDDRDAVDGYDSTVDIGGSSLYLTGSGNLVQNSDASSSSSEQFIYDEGDTNVVDVSNANIMVNGNLNIQINGSNDVITGAADDSFSIAGANDDVDSSYSNVAFAGGYAGDDVLGDSDTGSNWSAPDPDDSPGSGGYSGYSSTAAVRKVSGGGISIEDIAKSDKNIGHTSDPAKNVAFASDVSLTSSQLAAWLKASAMNTATTTAATATTENNGSSSNTTQTVVDNAFSTQKTPQVLPGSDSSTAASLSQFDLLTHAMGVFDSGEGLVDLPFDENMTFSEQKILQLASPLQSHSFA